ncbi:hypothetical protein AB0M39_32410 [Streptomyces sp. NPDC051907]|uniref:EF-Tu C-terminal domain-related protein n=1 Tax=Streptomyces sp. NPDC051907 TaxID=3155284 RepID=UPI00343A03B6
MVATEKPFLMSVEDVFRRSQGRVVRVTGRIERGRVSKDDEVELVGFDADAIAVVADIDDGGRSVGEAHSGMNVGLVLQGVPAGAIERGHVLAAPGWVTAHLGFAADMAVLSEEEGGAQVLTGQRLCFYARAAAVWGEVALPDGFEAIQPLGKGTVTVMLERPVALEEGQVLAFRHHGRAAGYGTVVRLLR